MNRVAAFGQVVRARRKELCLSQTALGARAGLHRTHISFIERGVHTVNLATVFALADSLDILASTMLERAENISQP